MRLPRSAAPGEAPQRVWNPRTRRPGCRRSCRRRGASTVSPVPHRPPSTRRHGQRLLAPTCAASGATAYTLIVQPCRSSPLPNDRPLAQSRRDRFWSHAGIRTRQAESPATGRTGPRPWPQGPDPQRQGIGPQGLFRYGTRPERRPFQGSTPYEPSCARTEASSRPAQDTNPVSHWIPTSGRLPAPKEGSQRSRSCLRSSDPFRLLASKAPIFSSLSAD